MMALLLRLCLGALLSIPTTLVALESAPEHDAIQWRTWSDSLLEEAQDEGRLLLLDVTASWCVFCKKMDRVTYRDQAVEAVVGEYYIAVRISDDKDPLRVLRYGDDGLPATVILDQRGRELIQRSGYLEPQLMAWMLQAVAQNPDPDAHR